MAKIGVIGAGFSSLSSASFLAKAGHEVHVFEKHDQTGGRARKFEKDGFVFDMGPSWYWMPGVFEQYFAKFDKDINSYYELIRLDPSYQVFFKNEIVNVPASLEELKNLFESWEKGSAHQLDKFLKEAAYKYEISINNIVYKPCKSITEFIDWDIIKEVFRLHIFQSFEKYIKKYFKDERILKLLEFPILFLGATAKTTPALYSIMNYADMKLGTWYPKGGMNKVPEAMTNLAKELGVQFHLSSSVESIKVENNYATGLTVDGKLHSFDRIVAGADYHHVEQKLLPKQYRLYDESYWQKRKMAPSSLLFYVGLNTKVLNLLHHNLFFDEEFKNHANEIYENPRWPSKPLFYVCCPSKSDASVAPEGHENLFFLMPVATDMEDEEEIREKYFNLMLERLEKRVGQSLKNHIVYKRGYAHKDFSQDYNAYKGNAYGLANTLDQTAIFKPSMVNKKVNGLVFTGQLTIPGPGVPPAIISGEIAANEIIKSL
ncbi:MAG: phytoene desaturase [Flavobacteriales bacterium]|jgi:phytoene desaturase